MHQIKTLKFWRSLVLQAFLFFFFLYLINSYQSRNVVTGHAPKLQGSLLTGEVIKFNTLLKDGPVLLYFWAEWCGVCNITSPMVNNLAKDHQVVSIAMRSGNEEQVSAYLKQQGLKFVTVNDPQGRMSQRWGVSATPTIIIINSDNSISSVITGLSTRWSIIFRLWFAQ